MHLLEFENDYVEDDDFEIVAKKLKPYFRKYKYPKKTHDVSLGRIWVRFHAVNMREPCHFLVCHISLQMFGVLLTTHARVWSNNTP